MEQDFGRTVKDAIQLARRQRRDYEESTDIAVEHVVERFKRTAERMLSQAADASDGWLRLHKGIHASYSNAYYRLTVSCLGFKTYSLHLVVIGRARVACDVRAGMDYYRHAPWLNMDEMCNPDGYICARVLELISHIADPV